MLPFVAAPTAPRMVSFFFGRLESASRPEWGPRRQTGRSSPPDVVHELDFDTIWTTFDQKWLPVLDASGYQLDLHPRDSRPSCKCVAQPGRAPSHHPFELSDQRVALGFDQPFCIFERVPLDRLDRPADRE